MLKRVRLNSQLLFVCWAKVKGINCSSQFHLHSFSLLRQKKIKNLLLATFRKQNFCTFVPRISLFCRLHTLGFLTSDRIITLFYCRRSNTNKKKKESKKGPREREREFGRIVRRPSSSSSSLFIIAREEEEEHIFEFAVKNLWVPPSVAST